MPVGGGRVLDAEKAAEIVSLLEPKIVIPMLYKTDASTGDFEPVDHFVKEMGAEAKTPGVAPQHHAQRACPRTRPLVLLSYRG